MITPSAPGAVSRSTLTAAIPERTSSGSMVGGPREPATGHDSGGGGLGKGHHSSEVLEIAHGMAGVFPAQPDFAAEAEVVADENLRAGDEAGGVGLVVRVAQAHDPGVIRGFLAREPHLEDTKVTGSIMAQGVGEGTRWV